MTKRSSREIQLRGFNVAFGCIECAHLRSTRRGGNLAVGVGAANALLHCAAAGVRQQAVGDAHDLHRQLPAGGHYDHLHGTPSPKHRVPCLANKINGGRTPPQSAARGLYWLITDGRLSASPHVLSGYDIAEAEGQSHGAWCACGMTSDIRAVAGRTPQPQPRQPNKLTLVYTTRWSGEQMFSAACCGAAAGLDQFWQSVFGCTFQQCVLAVSAAISAVVSAATVSQIFRFPCGSSSIPGKLPSMQ